MIVIKDRVKQLATATVATGDLSFSSTPNGYKAFSSVLTSGDQTYYCIENGSAFEIGIGTYGASGANTLSRDTILNSSTGSRLSISGRSTVFITVPASKFPFVTESGELSLALNSLNDVSLTAPSSGQILSFTGSEWVNGPVPGSYSNEEAQDAVGGILTDTSSISFSYNDGAPSISASVKNSGVTNDMLATGIDTAKIGNGAVSLAEFGYLDGVTSSLQTQLDSKYASANPSGFISAASVASAYQPLDADLTSLASASGSGIYERSGGSWTPVVIGTGLSLAGGALSNTLDLSSYLTSSVATATYLPLAGGTLTGDLKFTDATYDIGKSGATRPRDGFFSRNLSVGGQLTNALGIITTNTPVTLTQTWNNAAVSFTALNITVDNTAFSSSSKLFNFSCLNVVGGGTVPAVSFTPSTGTLRVDGPWSMGKLYLGSSGQSVNAVYATGLEIRNNAPDVLLLQVTTSYSDIGTQVGDASYPLGWAGVKLRKIADNQLELRNGTNAQLFRLSNTWTSTTSLEALQFKANAAAAYQIGSAVGSAGGTNRAIEIGHFSSAGTFTSALSIATTSIATFASDILGTNIRIQAGEIHAHTGNGFIIRGTLSASAPTLSLQTGAAASTRQWALYGGESSQFICSGNSNGGGTGYIFIGSGSAATTNPSSTTNRILFDTLAGRTIFRNISGQTANSIEVQDSAGSVLAAFTFAGSVTCTGATLTQPVSTSGSPTAFTVTGAAHTTLTLSTEATDVNFNLSRTVQFATGAITTQRAMRIQAPTYGFVGASTITTASTLSISGPPVAGTNATITNAYALNVESGYVNIAGAGGSAGIRFANAGTYWAPNILASNQLGIGSQAFIYIYHSNSLYMTFYNGTISTAGSLIGMGSATHGSTDVNLNRDSAGVLNIRNGTNAQTVRVTGTWTSSTSYETINIKGKASANFEIGPENGSAGGTLRGLTIGGYPAGTATIVGWAQFRPNTSTGALEAFYLGPIADSTTTGGNARGQYSIDLTFSQNRVAAAAVASGTNSVLIGGSRGTASGTNSVSIGGSTCAVSGAGAVGLGGTYLTVSGTYAVSVGGELCTASNNYAFTGGGTQNTASNQGTSVVGGLNATADRYGMEARASGRFAANGDAQRVGFTLRNKTTDATPVNLGLDGSTTRLTIPSGKTMTGFLIVKGIKSDGSAKARFVRLVDITNVGGTTALDTPIEAIGTDYNPSACVLAVTAENATDDLQINITGPAGETWRWVGTFNGLEIAYGT